MDKRKGVVRASLDHLDNISGSGTSKSFWNEGIQIQRISLPRGNCLQFDPTFPWTTCPVAILKILVHKSVYDYYEKIVFPLIFLWLHQIYFLSTVFISIHQYVLGLVFRQVPEQQKL